MEEFLFISMAEKFRTKLKVSKRINARRTKCCSHTVLVTPNILILDWLRVWPEVRQTVSRTKMYRKKKGVDADCVHKTTVFSGV